MLGLALGGLAGLSYVSVTRGQAERARLLEVARRQPFAPTEIVQLGLIPAELNESSGLGVSQAHPGVFWTHNDSGDEARVYALDERAMLVATVVVDGVEARDWEAMTLGRCPHESARSCLYAAEASHVEMPCKRKRCDGKPSAGGAAKRTRVCSSAPAGRSNGGWSDGAAQRAQSACPAAGCLRQ